MVATVLVLDDRADDGVRERRFDVRRAERTIPGLLWTPASPGPRTPLVLIGHGASGHKRTDYVAGLGRALARRSLAAAAIDGPVHGDRRADRGENAALTFLEFCQAWSSRPEMTDEMVADWSATLDELLSLEELAGSAVGWWGVSMGTILGLPFVAAEPRIAAAVLGLMGLTGPTRERIARDAPNVRCPVLFLVQWDDELFGWPEAAALFDALGTSDKRMHVHPGAHGALPQEAFRSSELFLAERLGLRKR